MINKVLLFDLGGVIINIDPKITIKNFKKKSNIESNILKVLIIDMEKKNQLLKIYFTILKKEK